MTTKDYIYFGLLIFSALIFYFNGYLAGANRCRKYYDRVLRDTPTPDATPTPAPVAETPRATATPVLEFASCARGQRPRRSESAFTIRAVFGKN